MRLLHAAAALAPYVIAFLPMEMTIKPEDHFGAWMKDQLATARARVPAEAA
jgi:hypothetical protein